MRSFWVTCLECEHDWVAQFMLDRGLLFNVDEFGDTCPECSSHEIEVGEEYPA